MSSIEQLIDTVRRVHETHGDAKLAKASGVAMTTIGAAKKRGFSSNSLETLMKLVEGAQKLEAGQEGADHASAA